jgi:hypothetical protein
VNVYASGGASLAKHADAVLWMCLSVLGRSGTCDVDCMCLVVRRRWMSSWYAVCNVSTTYHFDVCLDGVEMVRESQTLIATGRFPHSEATLSLPGSGRAWLHSQSWPKRFRTPIQNSQLKATGFLKLAASRWRPPVAAAHWLQALRSPRHWSRSQFRWPGLRREIQAGWPPLLQPRPSFGRRSHDFQRRPRS